MTVTPAHVDQHDATPQPDPDATDSLVERIAQLEAANARLLAELDDSSPGSTEPVPEPTSNRRNLLKLAAGAAAGGTALALGASSGRVAANDGDPIEVGAFTVQGNGGSRSSTILAFEGGDSPQVPAAVPGTFRNGNIMTVRDAPAGLSLLGFLDGSDYPAAASGKAYRAVVNGLYGYSQNGGAGVVGHGALDETGVFARGGRANLELYLEGDAPAARTDAHVVGEVVADSNGDLWYCAEAGSPGTWQLIAGPSYSPPVLPAAYTPVTPFRVYDSREETDGAFTGGENRTISVADSRDVETYAVVTADAVPSGATAVTGNVVAIQTTDTGFLSINPGGTTAITAATVNWASGMNIGNAGTFALNGSRELEAVFGPGNGAHMTIDITGYYT